MSKAKRRNFRKCPHCKMSVSIGFDCENPDACPNRESGSLKITRRGGVEGMRGRPTLDVQEGNLEELV